MKARRVVPFLAICLLLSSHSISYPDQFRVSRVHDGETLRAEGHGVEIVVRLAGIEAPGSLQDGEEDGSFALEAKSCLAEMTLNKHVTIEGHGVDEMNRVLGVLFVNGVNVNMEMIRSGCARVYRGDPPHPLYLLPYLKAEQSARRAKRGLWSSEQGALSSRQSKASL